MLILRNFKRYSIGCCNIVLVGNKKMSSADGMDLVLCSELAELGT